MSVNNLAIYNSYLDFKDSKFALLLLLVFNLALFFKKSSRKNVNRLCIGIIIIQLLLPPTTQYKQRTGKGMVVISNLLKYRTHHN